MTRPLEGIRVVDFSQFLSGPSASLRLADLGAEVVKIEKPVIGDICRQLYVSDCTIGGESTIFHAINRNKKSVVADLKDSDDLKRILALLTDADVLLHNFRPGVMDRLGLGYEAASAVNPGIVYAELSGYGQEGPWKDRPGQDLLHSTLDEDHPLPRSFGIVVERRHVLVFGFEGDRVELSQPGPIPVAPDSGLVG